MGLFGKKKKGPVEPPIKFLPKNELPPFDENMQEIYIQSRLFVKGALDARAETMLMSLSAGGLGTQYVIDGIPHAGPGMDRDAGATLMAMLKLVAGIDLNQPQPLVKGDFEIAYRRTKYDTQLVSQLSQAGEQMVLKFDDGTPPPKNAAEAGMREPQIEKLKQLLSTPGLLLVSAPPRGGLTTTFNATAGTLDRYVRNVVALEDAADNDQGVENIPVTEYNSAAGEKPMDVLPKLLRTYPDVICVRKLTDAAMIDLLAEQYEIEDRVVIAGIAAKDACEALLRVLAMKASREKLAKSVTAVINVRVVRMLCEHCKQQYLPPPQLLQQLGLPPNKQVAFYRPGPPPYPPDTKPENIPQICPVCNGIGYKGRSAIFELLEINDPLRKALLTAKSPDQLRQLAKKSGHASLIDEGVVAGARGMTSIQEVFRVLQG